MIQFARLFFPATMSLSKTPKRIATENVALRYQVSVLRRKNLGGLHHEYRRMR